MVSTYLVVIGRTSTGYSAHCPDVPGCASVGKTVEKVIANMAKALELHFEGMVEDGDALPKPGGVASYRKALKDPDLADSLLAHVKVNAHAPVHVSKRESRPVPGMGRPLNLKRQRRQIPLPS